MGNSSNTVALLPKDDPHDHRVPVVHIGSSNELTAGSCPGISGNFGTSISSQLRTNGVFVANSWLYERLAKQKQHLSAVPDLKSNGWEDSLLFELPNDADAPPPAGYAI